MPRRKPEPEAQPARLSGAVEHRSQRRVVFSNYVQSHIQNAVESFRRLVAEPLQSSMMVLVVAMALALPAMLYVAVFSLQELSGSLDSGAQMTLFLKKSAKQKAVKRLIQQLEKNTKLSSVQYIAPDEALDALRGSAGFGDAVALLDENPLPPVLLVNPVVELEASVQKVEQLRRALAKLPLVEAVQLDMKWLQRVRQILEFGRQITLLLGVVLAGGVLVVIGNTIRLAVENRSDEIRVVKLVGGTNSFVRRPFLYSGFWYGVMGGLLAWCGVAFAQFWLGAGVSRLALLYQSDFSLVSLGLEGMAFLIALGGGLGLLGARLAVGRYMAELEP